MALIEEFEKQGVWLFRYRGVLPLFILLIGGAVFAYTEHFYEYYFIKTSPYKIYYDTFCLIVSLFGLWIRVYTVGHTPKNTSGRNIKGQLADTLNTTGIYSLLRHPLYLGNFFMWIGPTMLIGHPWFIVTFCLFYWIYYERIMFAEEQFLRGKFGEEYLKWAEKVPAFFPKCKGFEKPAFSFSIKKALKKEKNGLAAVFLIFSAFNFAGEYVGLSYGYNYPLYIITAVSVILYIIIKIINKKSSILNEEGR